jgi:hypothetical protein
MAHLLWPVQTAAGTHLALFTQHRTSHFGSLHSGDTLETTATAPRCCAHVAVAAGCITADKAATCSGILLM